jgi:hypothetical protein
MYNKSIFSPILRVGIRDLDEFLDHGDMFPHMFPNEQNEKPKHNKSLT